MDVFDAFYRALHGAQHGADVCDAEVGGRGHADSAWRPQACDQPMELRCPGMAMTLAPGEDDRDLDRY